MGRKIVLVWAALAALFASVPLHAAVVDMKKVGQTWEAHVVKEHNFKVPVSVYPAEAAAIMRRGFALNPATAAATVLAGLAMSMYEAEFNESLQTWGRNIQTEITPIEWGSNPGCSAFPTQTEYVSYNGRVYWLNPPPHPNSVGGDQVHGYCEQLGDWRLMTLVSIAISSWTPPAGDIEFVPLSDVEISSLIDQLTDSQQQQLVDQVPYSDPLYDSIAQRGEGIAYDPSTDSNTANSYTNPTTGTTATQWPSFCKWASPVCSFIDWMKEEPPALPDPPEPSVQVESILIDDSILPNLQPRGCAIDPIEFSALGANGSIDTGPVCQLAQYASYLLLMIGGFIGFRIATGTTHKG